ncbi:hypothetical protein [Metabacillus bambusae]|uniref:HNH endonuclease 5 domain-containing protein n=1 Tax=Metabacillus bambusae TaxID=2795218 RepID=A0ABS3N6K7_9BACI|nr:hypothetical protein [Metabacillus bambusae]MBO1513701.1 hypothetical protein [Metabacillus bambusae]
MENTDKKKYFDPFENMSFTYDRCFLCGIELNEVNESEEHVFPKWLLEKYNLWNDTLTLLNGTRIPYRMLKIPCCTECNNNHLSNMENTIKKGLEDGYEKFANIDRVIVYQWISKIFYGLLFKELSLTYDRSKPSSGTITTPELLKGYRMTHSFMQSVRYPIEFEGFQPWSIHILEGQVSDNRRIFNYIDGLNTLTFSINLGTIIIFAHLQDNGIHQVAKNDYFNKLKGCKLHNVQFIEIATKLVYSSYLLNHSPYYMLNYPNEENEPLKVFSLSSSYYYDDWDETEYANLLHYYLSHFYEIEIENVYSKKDQKCASFIRNNDGSFNEIPVDAKIVFNKYD